MITVTGGPVEPGRDSSLKACKGRARHGYVGQEKEVVDGLTRFIRGGRY